MNAEIMRRWERRFGKGMRWEISPGLRPFRGYCPNFGFSDAMYDHIASEMIAVIAHHQASFELGGDLLKREYVGECVRGLHYTLNERVDKGIGMETVKKCNRYYIKVTGDPWVESRPLLPWTSGDVNEYGGRI